MIAAASTSDNRTLDSVEFASARLNASKYEPIRGMSQPTTTVSSSSTSMIWLADVASSMTRVTNDRGNVGILERRSTARPPSVVPDEVVLHADSFERRRGRIGIGRQGAKVALDALGVALRGGDRGVDAFGHEARSCESVGGRGEEHGQQERTQREDQQDPSAQPERGGPRTIDQATEPAALVHVWSRYPSPRTVTTCRGLAGSASTLVRSRRTCTSTSRPSPK